MARTAPFIVCECGTTTEFAWDQPGYRFECRDCGALNEGEMPFAGLHDALSEAVFRLRAATLNDRTQQEDDTLRKAVAVLAKCAPVTPASADIAKDVTVK